MSNQLRARGNRPLKALLTGFAHRCGDVIDALRRHARSGAGERELARLARMPWISRLG
jgi:hypothetical protein